MRKCTVYFKRETPPTFKVFYKVQSVRYEGAAVIVTWEGDGWRGAITREAFPMADVERVEDVGDN